MGCKAPREGHCEARVERDKSDTLVLCLGLCLSRSQRKQIPARRMLPCIFVSASLGRGLATRLFCVATGRDMLCPRQSMTAGLPNLWKYPLQRLF